MTSLLDMKKDYRFFIYTILQASSLFFLVLCFLGFLFWDGNDKIEVYKENASKALESATSQHLMMISNIFEFVKIRFNEDSKRLEKMIDDRISRISINESFNSPSIININNFTTNTVRDYCFASFKGNKFFRIGKGNKRIFQIGDLWINGQRIRDIEDYYFIAGDTYYFTEQL